jgi:hypothetical protein
MAAVEEKLTEIFSMSQDPALAEAGGGHGQKGVDFQRFWAMVRIFELKQKGAEDFLILFESVQDVAELDSETAPTRIDIYQVKKKDGGEWSFNLLTGLPKPDARKKNVPPTRAVIEKSPIGKLYLAGQACQHLESAVHFVSNAGCDLPLATSGAASKRLACLAADLDAQHTAALEESLALLHASPGTIPDLKRLSLRKTTLHPDDPVRLALGAAVEYLSKNMPSHAGQAKALVDALFMQLSTLGRQTEPVKSFAELRLQRGFSMGEMDAALGALTNVPDLKAHIDMMLDGLTQEGLSTIRKLGINVGVSKYFSNLVSGTSSAEELTLIGACAGMAGELLLANPILPALEAKVKELAPSHTAYRDTEVFAYLLIQVTKHATA